MGYLSHKMDLHNYQEWIAERQRLIERIKELEAENAELKKRLGEDVVHVVHEPTAMHKLSASCFGVCSRDVRTCLPGGGTARRAERVAISQYAKMNGVVNYVISESSSAPNARIVCLLHWQTMIYTDTWREKTQMAGM